jgi:two-component system, OmpR family, response regulator
VVRVLVVEDEPKMAALLRRGLVEEGYAVDVEADGVAGLGAVVSRGYDAVVLDVMPPKMSGFEVCRRMRQARVWVPVLVLTARDALADRVAGLDGGADDYLTKPVSPRRAVRAVAGADPARSGGAANPAGRRGVAGRSGQATLQAR